jgi:predicted TIM-barrel fold metal-dependent hydrolase
MNSFEVIGAHTHISESIKAEKAQFPSAMFPALTDEKRWAHAEKVIPYMDKNGISKIVTLSIFPTWAMTESRLKRLPADLSAEQHRNSIEEINEMMAERVRRHNQAIMDMCKKYPRIIPFINVQKVLGGAEEMVKELELRVHQGAKGVKIHPGLNRFFPNDPDYWPIYERCQELGLPIVSDSGFCELSPPPYHGGDWGEPMHFAEILRKFNRLTLVLAHLGSPFWDERVELAQRFPNVYFDTSLGFKGLAPWGPESTYRERFLHEVDAVRIIRKIGVDRVMFGSDAPGGNQLDQIEQILRMDLGESEKGMILAGNAKRILNI